MGIYRDDRNDSGSVCLEFFEACERVQQEYSEDELEHPIDHPIGHPAFESYSPATNDKHVLLCVPTPTTKLTL